MMQDEFLFSGFGGQGVMFAGQLLAYAAMDAGMEVTWIPSYGPEMRGGTAHCIVVLSDKPICSPVVKYPLVILAFNLPSFDKYEPLVKPGGLLVFNQSLVAQSSKREDIVCLAVPATEFAEEAGDTRLTNMVLLGAALVMRPVLSIDCIERSIEQHIPYHRRHLLDANFKALAHGVDFARNQRQLMPVKYE